MRTRTMVGAFLTRGERVLMIHRGMHKRIAAGMWSCVGGHMEPGELGDPERTCYREIEEEAGIDRACIEGLRLRYVTMRVVDDEVRTGYYYVGALTRECALPPCDEGTLHWVRRDALLDREMTHSNRLIVEHWLTHPDGDAVMALVSDRAYAAATWVEM